MESSEEERRRAAALHVLALLGEALDLMDAHALSAHAAAHVDLGKERLLEEFPHLRL